MTQYGTTARVVVTGDGDLAAAAEQVRRFLSLDVDARGWPAVAERDPVIAEVQARWPGLRPCGFHSPYEAAAWAVLTQRTGMTSARRMRDDLIARYGTGGAFPSPRPCSAWTTNSPGARRNTCTPWPTPRSTDSSTAPGCAP